MTWTAEDKLLQNLLFDTTDCGTFSSPFDWNLFMKKSMEEGVSGIVFHNIRNYHLEGPIPPGILNSFTDIHFHNIKKIMTIISRLRIILLAFKAAGISCMVLKGIALAEKIYPSIAMRGMSDVDVMVKKEDLYKVDDCLSSLGFVCKDSTVSKAFDNPEGYLASLEYESGNGHFLNLHVHWHIVNTSVPATMFVKNISTERLWEKSVTAKIADVDVQILCPEHLVIYLCEHALRIGHSFDRMILICDIYYTIKAYERVIDWNFIVEESNRFNVSRFVFFSLSVVKHYTSLNIPAEHLEQFKPHKITAGERLFLNLMHNNQRIRGCSYFIYLAMNSGLSQKLTFLFRTLYPPAQILLQRKYAGEDVQSINLYYLSRMGEVFLQFLRIFFHRHIKNT